MMRAKPHIFWRSRAGAMLIAAVAAFAFSQILISVHAAQFGDGPHDHGGQACVLSLAAPGGDKAIAAAAAILAVFAGIWFAGLGPSQTERAAIAIRSARPRGPPSRR